MRTPRQHADKLSALQSSAEHGVALLTRQAAGTVMLPGELTIQGGSDFIVTGDDALHGFAPLITVTGAGSTMQTISGGNLDVLVNAGGLAVLRVGASAQAEGC